MHNFYWKVSDFCWRNITVRTVGFYTMKKSIARCAVYWPVTKSRLKYKRNRKNKNRRINTKKGYINWKSLSNEGNSKPRYNLKAQQQPSKRLLPCNGKLFFFPLNTRNNFIPVEKNNLIYA